MRVAVAGGTGVVGAHAVAALTAGGHEVVVLARSTGIDLLDPAGLGAALDGAAAVVDVTSIGTTSATASIRFFETVTRNLLAAERGAGVAHHVALSIVGVPDAPFGYYAGKARQESLVAGSDGGWTLVRATQFHEFAPQMIRRGRIGPAVVVPVMDCRPIAAARVGAALAEIATGAPQGVARDLAGPRRERMPDLVRRYLRAPGSRRPVVAVPLPGGFGRALRDGTLLPGAGARIDDLDFTTWLAGEIQG